jgi:response regulator RpfG family c-di-GMP phosphodiesterase
MSDSIENSVEKDGEQVLDKYDTKSINILYVDDEVINLKAFQANYRRVFNVFIARTAKEGEEVLDSNDIHVVLSDQRMPEITGVEFFENIKDKHPDTIRILITAFSNIQAVIDAINKGNVYRYVTKPWDKDELQRVIQNAFEVYVLREENKILTESLIQANKQLEFMLRQKLLD